MTSAMTAAASSASGSQPKRSRQLRMRLGTSASDENSSVPGARRDASRATRSHATVEVDGRDQAELWAPHRVGGRPRVALLEVAPREEAQCLALEGGDDYELCFTAPPGSDAAVAEIAETIDLPLTRVGSIVAGTGVRAHDGDGQDVEVDVLGYRHFGDEA